MFDSTVVRDAPGAAVDLIPEAKQRQRRRYRRSAVVVSLVAVLVGALVALLLTVTSSGSGTPREASKPPSVVTAGRVGVLVRPVQCFAFWPSVARQKDVGPLPACGPYALTAAALALSPNPSGSGYSSNGYRPDPALWGYPTSTRDRPDRVVLLDGLWPPTGPKQKYLLGPSEMRLSAADVGSVATDKHRNGQWVVTIHLTSAGARTLDRVAQQNFHQLLAVDMGGKVVDTPLVQPTRSSFTSFHGVIQISALNAANARAIAAAVQG